MWLIFLVLLVIYCPGPLLHLNELTFEILQAQLRLILMGINSALWEHNSAVGPKCFQAVESPLFLRLNLQSYGYRTMFLNIIIIILIKIIVIIII